MNLAIELFVVETGLHGNRNLAYHRAHPESYLGVVALGNRYVAVERDGSYAIGSRTFTVGQHNVAHADASGIAIVVG